MHLENITGEINWGEATDLIKHEGFYMFGGRLENNEATNQLLIIKVAKDYKDSRKPSFRIFEPKVLGKPPTERYMHTMNYMTQLNVITIYGGRNDFLAKKIILDDLWLLKLHNMEWVKVQIGGDNLPIARCNHTSYGNGTELIISGGQG